MGRVAKLGLNFFSDPGYFFNSKFGPPWFMAVCIQDKIWGCRGVQQWDKVLQYHSHWDNEWPKPPAEHQWLDASWGKGREQEGLPQGFLSGAPCPHEGSRGLLPEWYIWCIVDLEVHTMYEWCPTHLQHHFHPPFPHMYINPFNKGHLSINNNNIFIMIHYI